GRAIYVLAIQADGPVAIKVSPGSEMPLHSTSAGKVLLAALPDGEARKILGNRKLSAITPHTVTDPAALIALLPRVRRQGYATVNEENIPCGLSVSAPIPVRRGVPWVGALIRARSGGVGGARSAAFPKYSDPGLTLASLEPLVIGAALNVSRMLGMPSAMLLTGSTGSGSGGT